MSSESFCRTDPLDAKLYVYVTLRNDGADAGEIDIRPWRRYNDGSVNDSVMDLFTVEVSSGQTEKTYGEFNYNALEHELLECGVYLGSDITPTTLDVTG